jgi:hypothetical protein
MYKVKKKYVTAKPPEMPGIINPANGILEQDNFERALLLLPAN